MRFTMPQDIPSQDRLADAIQNLANAISASGSAPADAAGEAAADLGDGAVEAGSSLVNVPTDLEGMQAWLQLAQDKLVEFLPALAGAIVIFVLGWAISRLLTSLVRKTLGKSKIDKTLINFLCSMMYVGLMIFVVVSAISKLGVNTTSFIAILGAAGFAVGFAMQGSLSNFAAGVMMMIFRPIREGELVEAGGVLGIVQEVGVFATVINTLENKKAIISNAAITTR